MKLLSILLLTIGMVSIGHTENTEREKNFSYMDKAGYLPAWEEMYAYDDNWIPDRLQDEWVEPKEPITPNEEE